MQHIYGVVRKLRLERALSQEELASKAGVDRATIMRMERGQAVRPNTLRRVARALGVQPVRLTVG
jgi:transcriptional regulator with XRE-family HTH domain